MSSSRTSVVEESAADCDAVCDLEGAELEARRAWIRREIRPRVVGREALDDGIALRFHRSPENEALLEDFVAFERGCCGGLRWTLEAADRDALRLEIRGRPPESDFFRRLLADEAPPAPSHARRALQALGLGSIGALLVCCGGPALIAILGGAVGATAWRALDTPEAIAVATVGLSTGAWLWLGRRRRGAERTRAVARSESTGCGC